ncbi:MAG: ChbG/HpnK family deacetylase [Elusimicrobiota bacterium]|nr:ChbG/HpnK family deacetylase [Endomicrobiia bacterium]MCX7910272.1 ChbG/HpnK family deacetylase [Endomicrobiia bacterium]MDW8165911.1 ChbG/HpnK family deacetylase [Elusimicrobiota bacterium]
MKKLIVNADDFGFNSKINQGIIYAFKNGVVTSTSLIVTYEGLKDAINLAKDNPRLSVGIHIDLDKFFEIDHSRGKIVGYKVSPLPLDEIKSEIKRQIEVLLSEGIVPDHLSGHHHVHLVDEIFPIVVEVMKEYKIPSIRFHRKILYSPDKHDEFKNLLDSNNIVYPPYFIEGWYWGNIDEPYTIAELLTHPGYGELWREYELSSSCDPKLKLYLREKNIQLITYKDLVEEFKTKNN